MEPDKDQHQIIFEATLESLGYVAAERKHLIPPELRAPYQKAWEEAEQTLTSAKKYVAEKWESLEQRLAAVGLTGKQLRLKYEIILRALSRWRAKMDDVGLLHNLLARLRSFFYSLIDEVPGSEIIKEFLDAVLNMIEEVSA